MTTYNQTTLKTFFATGDIPTGQNFSDFIDSYINIVNTNPQSMAGSLSTTELNAPLVSAARGNFSGNMTIGGTLSAATLSIDTLAVSALAVNFINATGNILAQQGTIFASANRWSVGIVSAAGTAQASAAQLIYTVNEGAGVVDGQTTGFLLPSNNAGRIQYIINGAASANLWPPTGGQINALASNAAFALAANIPYTIIHTLASGYAVK